jgi:hypothetical protein
MSNDRIGFFQGKPGELSMGRLAVFISLVVGSAAFLTLIYTLCYLLVKSKTVDPMIGTALTISAGIVIGAAGIKAGETAINGFAKSKYVAPKEGEVTPPQQIEQ